MGALEKERGYWADKGDGSGEQEWKRPASFNAYLKGLKKDFNIHRIYYPGCGSDTTLENVFTASEIVYMDDFDESLGKKDRQFIFGDHEATPFGDGVFDAIYYSDSHVDNQQFLELLRTLRVGGIIIRDEFVCGDEITYGEIADMPSLAQTNYPADSGFPMYVFQKVAETPKS